MAVANIGVLVIGPLAGTVVLLLTGAGFALVNLISGLIGMVMLPWAGTVIAMLYADLQVRATDGAGPTDEAGAGAAGDTPM
jgi:hypothetical protein